MLPTRCDIRNYGRKLGGKLCPKSKQMDGHTEERQIVSKCFTFHVKHIIKGWSHFIKRWVFKEIGEIICILLIEKALNVTLVTSI